MTPVDGLAQWLVASHRYLLVLATTGIGITGSRVASDPRSIPDWLLLGSAALAMYVTEVCREAEHTATKLPAYTAAQRRQARVDAFWARGSRTAMALALLVVVLAISAIVIAWATTGRPVVAGD
jgi:hypothetical protein